jgi:hypothetical protein
MLKAGPDGQVYPDAIASPSGLEMALAWGRHGLQYRQKLAGFSEKPLKSVRTDFVSSSKTSWFDLILKKIGKKQKPEKSSDKPGKPSDQLKNLPIYHFSFKI